MPALDCVYKLQEYAGIARRKRAVNKITWPGRKQVWRRYGADGRMAGDILSLETDKQSGEPLLKLVMQGGRRVQPAPSLDDIRSHAKRELERLPEPLRRLEPGAAYPVDDRRRVEGPGGGSRPPHRGRDAKSILAPAPASQQQNSRNGHCPWTYGGATGDVCNAQKSLTQAKRRRRLQNYEEPVT